ncbi:MAG: orotidine-5'-phosphate decarboxylase [Anaerolineaceae bacterium]|nr:orotidine-5'-phosphate decarboxylase [Anaerolineaceae bacterium]
MNPIEKYNTRVDQSHSLVCVGLDSDIKYIPRQFRDDPFPQFAFNRWVIEETHHYVSAFKPNIAFYEARGDRGLAELKMTIDYLQERHPQILTICDAKRADIGTINAAYIESIFDWLGFDAVTLQPYLGRQAIQPFLDRADKGAIIICRTSAPGTNDLQDIKVEGRPLWQCLAQQICGEWNVNQNCMLVIASTIPSELQDARQLAGLVPFLIPSVGTQGGTLKKVVEWGSSPDGKGLIINSARSVIFSDNPNGAVKRLRDEINQYRPKSSES